MSTVYVATIWTGIKLDRQLSFEDLATHLPPSFFTKTRNWPMDLRNPGELAELCGLPLEYFQDCEETLVGFGVPLMSVESTDSPALLGLRGLDVSAGDIRDKLFKLMEQWDLPHYTNKLPETHFSISWR